MKLFRLSFLLFCALSFFKQAAAASMDDVGAGLVLSAEETQQAVQGMAEQVEAHYLYQDKAKTAAALLRAKLASGDFNRRYDVGLLNLQISALLAKATNDTGFEVMPTAATARRQGLPPLIGHSEGGNTKDGNTAQHQHDQFETGMLDTHIGYIKITGNFDYPDSSQLIATQFQALASAEALIIDLRHADHASLEVALQMLSYFIEPGTAIAKLQLQQQVDTIYTLTLSKASPLKLKLPIYIVNSAFVAGSWEFFGYTLQQRTHAVIVGEESIGVGYLSQSYHVSEQLAIRLNNALLTDPQTGKHWDNEGVVPDYFYPSVEAFDKAYQLALAGVAAR